MGTIGIDITELVDTTEVLGIIRAALKAHLDEALDEAPKYAEDEELRGLLGGISTKVEKLADLATGHSADTCKGGCEIYGPYCPGLKGGLWIAKNQQYSMAMAGIMLRKLGDTRAELVAVKEQLAEARMASAIFPKEDTATTTETVTTTPTSDGGNHGQRTTQQKGDRPLLPTRSPLHLRHRSHQPMGRRTPLQLGKHTRSHPCSIRHRRIRTRNQPARHERRRAP